MNICNKCFNLTLYSSPEHYCEKDYSVITGRSCDGTAIVINSYFDMSNYDIVKLYLNEDRSLTLLHENFKDEKEFPINASRVVALDYIDEVPRFLPYIPFYREDVPNEERFRILEHLKNKIKAYEKYQTYAQKFECKFNSTYINKVLQMSFPSKIKEKITKVKNV